MGADEAGALAQLKTLRKEVFDPRIAEHLGTLNVKDAKALLDELA